MDPVSSGSVLVVGGTGLLGSALVAGAEGAPTVATWHRREPATIAAPGGAAWVRLDLAQPEADLAVAVDRLLDEPPTGDVPVAVVNAAYAMGDDLDAVTATAPGVLARACATRGIRFVQVSTDVVFDGTIAPGRSYGEDDPVSPAHDYGRAKVAAERAVADADPGAVIVRTSLLYPGRPAADVAAAVGGAGFVFYTDELRNPCRAVDLAAFLRWLALDPAGRSVTGVVHAAGADVVDRHRFAVLLAGAAGFDASVLVGGPTPPGGPPRPRNCALRSDRRLPGLPLPGVETVLRRS